MKKYPLIKSGIDYSGVSADLEKILSSGQLTSGQYVQKFEKAVADYVGTEFAAATTSCTTGLHLILAAMEIGPGDEVLVSDFSFPASGNVIVQTGATPVFVDCRKAEYILDIADAGKKISKKTKAIMVVDPFGQPGDLEKSAKFAKDHGIYLIEDSACSIGSSSAGKKCGAAADAACFSFHPRKVITTGEGGMITTSSAKLMERISILRSHGGIREEYYFKFILNGFNYRMTEIQAAIGLNQLARLENIIAERRKIAAIYKSHLKEMEYVSLPQSVADNDWNFQSFVITLADHIDRDKIIGDLREKGIESTLGTYAMHAHPAFARFGYKPGDLPNSWRAERQTLTLPLFSGMNEVDIEYVAENLREVCE